MCVLTVRVNVVGTVALTDACFRRNIPCTVYATGCIYEVSISWHHSHSTTLSILWAAAKASPRKTSPTSPAVSTVTPRQWPKKSLFLCKTHHQLQKVYPNVLILRVRMPISDDLSPRNFITKISKYERVVNIPNSMSVLYDLLPISIELTLHDCRVFESYGMGRRECTTLRTPA